MSDSVDETEVQENPTEDDAFRGGQGAMDATEPPFHRTLAALAELQLPRDLLERLRLAFAGIVPHLADADYAIVSLERMLANTQSSRRVLTFLLDEPNALSALMQLFASSQFFGDAIVKNPEYFDYLWKQGHISFDAEAARAELAAEFDNVERHSDKVMVILRRHRERELLRIGYRDVVLGESLEDITRSISELSECHVDLALELALADAERRFGVPRNPDGSRCRVVVLGLGKLGGRELNYSSDIDLVFVYESEGHTDGARSISNSEFFAVVIQQLIRLLTRNTEKGQAYRIDLRLRPYGSRAPLALSFGETLTYYELHGRTWERQALVKARPVAGARSLGDRLLEHLDGFVYRRYLSFAEINEIKSMKRKIETAARGAGRQDANLKTGSGGIRDIEFVAQFLQLIYGGAHPSLRRANTLEALSQLAAIGCINPDEHTSLDTAYRFLRRAEHRLQFLFDLQTHRLPDDPFGIHRLAIRLGYRSGELVAPADRFLADLRAITDRNRAILRRLMMDLFVDPESNKEAGEPETDLLLDPAPQAELIETVLKKFRFHDAQAAYRNLMKLAEEEAPFLSSMRCRHFLAGIAPRFLAAIGRTPDPDMTLANLVEVSSSLGAKGVLWESFSLNQPMLDLYVALCAFSRFLSTILINNPGMIDELLDMFVLNRWPTLNEMEAELRALVRTEESEEAILNGFKNTWLLGVGLGDLLDKAKPEITLLRLSQVAEVIVRTVADRLRDRLVPEFGRPRRRDGAEADFAILALGKLGGEELGYNSDLDLIIVYECDGETAADDGNRPRRGATSNVHFFSELAQRLTTTMGRLSPHGQLYQVDLRLRPGCVAGSIVISAESLERYFGPGGSADTWERLAFIRARVLGDRPFARALGNSLLQLKTNGPLTNSMIEEVRSMRRRLEASRPATDLKRAPGGLVDVEFAVELLQIAKGRHCPAIVDTNVLRSLSAIENHGFWPRRRCLTLRDGYRFLGRVENRMRIIHNVRKSDLPPEGPDLDRLAHVLGVRSDQPGASLKDEINQQMASIRREYLAVVEELASQV